VKILRQNDQLTGLFENSFNQAEGVIEGLCIQARNRVVNNDYQILNLLAFGFQSDQEIAKSNSSFLSFTYPSVIGLERIVRNLKVQSQQKKERNV
jgi:hypothetical protein